MMRLNWFSPLPPALTDIGHYSARILPALSRRCKVTLWTEQEQWDPDLERFAAVRRYDPDRLPWAELNRSDATFYNIGNNAEFHLAIWKASQQYPGIVVLHDVRVQEFCAYVHRWVRGKLDEYKALLTRHYGPQGGADAELWWHDRLPMKHMIENYAMIPWALEGAYAALVHTRQGYEQVKRESDLPLALAPLPYIAGPGNDIRTTVGRKPPYRVIVFGYIGRNRRLESVLEALAGLPERDLFTLDIYGQLWDPALINGKIEAVGLKDRVKVHGFVPEEELDAALDRADIAVNLRNPTMGEASGSQLRIWDHALPSLVTRIGMYADLPADTVAFVRPDHEIADIQDQLRAFAADPERFARMGRKGREVLEQVHSPEAYAEAILRYARAVRRQRRARIAVHLADEVGRVMAKWGPTADWDPTYRAVATHIHGMVVGAE